MAEVAISITLKIQAPNVETGQQMAATFCEPAIRQITGQQVPRKDGLFDIEQMRRRRRKRQSVSLSSTNRR